LKKNGGNNQLVKKEPQDLVAFTRPKFKFGNWFLYIRNEAIVLLVIDFLFINDNHALLKKDADLHKVTCPCSISW
jgi:hypothetical protein